MSIYIYSSNTSQGLHFKLAVYILEVQPILEILYIIHKMPCIDSIKLMTIGIEWIHRNMMKYMMDKQEYDEVYDGYLGIG